MNIYIYIYIYIAIYFLHLRTKQPVGYLVADRGRGRSHRCLQCFLAFGIGITSKRFPLARHCGRRNATTPPNLSALQGSKNMHLWQHASRFEDSKTDEKQCTSNNMHRKDCEQVAAQNILSFQPAIHASLWVSKLYRVNVKQALTNRATTNLVWHAKSEINSEA